MRTEITELNGVIHMVSWAQFDRDTIELDRDDIDLFHWDKAQTLLNGDLSVPVYTHDIDGDGPHSGNLVIQQSGAELDWSVGDWEFCGEE